MRAATTILAISVSLLLAMGVVFLCSAVMTEDQGLFYRQLIHLAAGVIICTAIACMDYRWLKKSAWLFYGIAVVLLVLVLAGGLMNGSRRWVSLGPIGFQPSEIGKLALIIALAAFADRHQRKLGTFKYGAVYMGGVAALILGLIVAEPDYGTTLVLGAVVGVMMLISGVRISHLALLSLGGALMVGGMIYKNENRMMRITAYFHPEEHKDGAGYQAGNATTAVSTGRTWGVGLADSWFKKKGMVPYHYSDMIFSVIGAELGLIGAMGAVFLYLIFLCSGVYIAWRARDMFGLMIATGVSFFISLQAIIHIGVVTSVLPNKGFPLPFMSHGGTNLMFNLIAVGLLFSIARHGLVRVKSKKNPFDRHEEVPVAGTV